VNAERKSIIPPGEIGLHLRDLLAVAVPLHPSFPLLTRASEIALLTRLTVASSLYVALAEREQCQFLTAFPKVIRNTRKHFSFILPFASLP
jgi:predicted nucleic acid-binding protein